MIVDAIVEIILSEVPEAQIQVGRTHAQAKELIQDAFSNGIRYDFVVFDWYLQRETSGDLSQMAAEFCIGEKLVAFSMDPETQVTQMTKGCNCSCLKENICDFIFSSVAVSV
jgi:hypothetical protein